MNVNFHLNKILSISLVAMLLATTCVVVDMTENDEEIDDSDAFGIGTLALCVGVSLLVGYLWGSNSGDNTASEIEKAMTEEQANALFDTLNAYNEMATQCLGVDGETWAFTDSYWSRLVELQVATDWVANSTIDYDKIINTTAVRDNISAAYYNWQSILDESFYSLKDIETEWANADYQNLSFGWGYDTTTPTVILDGSASMYTDFLTKAVATTNNNSVYIDTELPDDDNSVLSKVVYATQTGTLYDSDGNVAMNLSVGANSISSLESGIYTLSNGTYYGSFMSVAVESATITGAIVCVSGVDMSNGTNYADSEYLFVNTNGTDLTVTDINGTATTYTSFGYTVSYNGTTLLTDLSDLVIAWNERIGVFNDTIGAVKQVIQTEWTLFDTVGSASSSVSVSALLPDLTSYNMTDEQRYALTVALLSQMSEWYYENENALDLSNVEVSAESLDLVCYGNITANGTTYTNVVFTPYCYNSDLTLLTDGTTKWNQTGIALIWGTVDSETDWDGTISMNDMDVVTLGNGDKLNITNIVYDGKSVDFVTLNVKEISKVTASFSGNSDPTKIPGVADLTGLLQIALCGIAVAVGLFGFTIRDPRLILIAIVLGLAGYFFADGIATIILGVI